MNTPKLFLAIFSLLSFGPDIHAQSNNWNYIQIDDKKSKWGDYPGATPEWLRYFGLAAGDLNGDGLADILTGRWIYLNPGGSMVQSWEKIDLGYNVDGILIVDVDNDEYPDVIAQALPNVVWLEANNSKATSWDKTVIGQIPETSHRNSQGFLLGQVVEGGQPEILIASNGDVYCFKIPDQPKLDEWSLIKVAYNTSDEGISLGDIDNDGDLDLVAGRRAEGEDEPRVVVWFENPGQLNPNWSDYELGSTNHPADRIGVADFTGDNRPEIVVCEERYPGLEPDGNLFIYGALDDIRSAWRRKHIATQYSSNNLDIADLDLDGDLDILTSEHKGPNPELQIWKNDGLGNFMKEVIDRGKESHLGTQFFDMDNDGDLDIVSIGWDHYQYVHLWRNDD